MIKSHHITENSCGICLEIIENSVPLSIVTLPCKHEFHWDCMKKNIMINGEDTTCPMCRHSLPIRNMAVQATNGHKYPRIYIQRECNNCDTRRSANIELYKKKIALTTYTLNTSFSINDDEKKKYMSNTIYADDIIIEQINDDEFTIIDMDDTMIRYQQRQFILQRTETHEPLINFTVKDLLLCSSRCIILSINCCCECLVVGFIIGVTYGIIYGATKYISNS